MHTCREKHTFITFTTLEHVNWMPGLKTCDECNLNIPNTIKTFCYRSVIPHSSTRITLFRMLVKIPQPVIKLPFNGLNPWYAKRIKGFVGWRDCRAACYHHHTFMPV